MSSVLFARSIAALVCVIALAGCSNSSNLSVEADATATEWSAGDQVVINPTTSRLVQYDTAIDRYREPSGDISTSQIFEYGFGVDNRFFTTGSSAGGAYRLIERRDGQVVEVFKTDENSGLFPLATNGTDYTFLLVHYKENAIDSTELMTLRDGKFVDQRSFDNFVTQGVLDAEQVLTYAVFNSAAGAFDIRAVELGAGDQTPTTLTSAALGTKLLLIDDQVVLDGQLPLDSRAIRCEYFCAADAGLNMIVEVWVNAEDTLTLQVTNQSTGDVLANMSGDVIGTGAYDGQLMVMVKGEEPSYVARS